MDLLRACAESAPAGNPNELLNGDFQATVQAVRLPRQAWVWALPVASLVASSVVPFVGKGEVGDLSGYHTDHLRHPYAAWIALHRGLAVYRQPLSQAAVGVEYRHPTDAWGQVPYAYPPGALVLFMPVAVAGQYLPLSEWAYARLGLLYVVLLSHLAWAAVLVALRQSPPGLRWLVAGLAWLHFIHTALQGFYDAAWVGCGAMAIALLYRRRHGPALLWLCAAALLHLRAVVLAPLGVLALLGLARETKIWRQLEAYSAALVVGTGVGTFVLISGHAAGFREGPPLYVHAGTSHFWIAAAFSMAAAALALVCRDLPVAAIVALTWALALVDTSYWWHATVLLAAPLAVGVAATPRLAWLLRGGLVFWAIHSQRLIWGGRPWDVVGEIASAMR